MNYYSVCTKCNKHTVTKSKTELQAINCKHCGTFSFNFETIAEADYERFYLLDQLTETQHDFYLLGTCFISAYFTHIELQNNVPVSEAHKYELSIVVTILNKYKLQTPLNKE